MQRIAALERSVHDVQGQLAEAEARYQRLRQEMLLRWVLVHGCRCGC